MRTGLADQLSSQGSVSLNLQDGPVSHTFQQEHLDEQMRWTNCSTADGKHKDSCVWAQGPGCSSHSPVVCLSEGGTAMAPKRFRIGYQVKDKWKLVRHQLPSELSSCAHVQK